MESDILTGKKLNEAKSNTTEEALDAILRNAQDQLNRDMSSDTARLDRKRIERELAEKERLEKERSDKERMDKENAEKAAREQAEGKRLEDKRLAEEKATREQAEREKLAKEKAAREQAEREKLAKEKAVREQAEREKLAKEKAAREQAEREKLAKEKAAREQAERDRFAKERAAKEKAEKDQAARDKLQQLERERLVKEKAEIEKFAKEWNDQEKAEKQKRALEEIEKTLPKKTTADNSKTGRIDIQVDDQVLDDLKAWEKNGAKRSLKEESEKAARETVAAAEAANDPFVDYDIKPPIEKKLGLTVGDVISGILEFIWRMFKLAVLISIVTAIVGFFLSREMLIRGRNGNLHSLEDMKASSTVLSNKNNRDLDVNGWLRTVKREKLTMESDDGYILVARKIIQKGDSDRWAVILHGYNGSMEDIYDIAMNYYKEDYNILMPDLRASGESEGSFIGMGWLDRLDVINWIDVILDDNPSAQIAIHGVDMGADAALMLSGEPIKDNIMVIVADGAYTSAWDVIKEEYKARHEEWPVFPFADMINPVAKVWGGYSLKEADAVVQVGKTNVPILLISGGQDTYVTPDMANTLNESIASVHKLVTIPSGMHEDCRYADPTTYYNATFNFVDEHMIK